MPVGVMGGAALIGAGTSLITGNKAAKAQGKAADQQVAEYRRQYDLDRADFAPWREVGKGALAKVAGMYGVGPAGEGGEGPGDYGGFFTSPGYEFRRDEGIKAVERSAASRGLLRSGAGVKAVERYADGLAASEYDAFTNRLMGLAGLGQEATGATSAAGQAATQGVAGAYGMAGNARASSYANTGSAINSGINNALSAYMYFNQPTVKKPPISGGGW